MGLTQREREVLTLIGLCHCDKDIAILLFCSVKTVSAHITQLYRKLEAQNRQHLAVTAVRYGLSTPAVRGSRPVRQAG